MPPAWFLGLERVLQGSPGTRLVPLALISIVMVAVIAAMVAVTYIVLFREFERLMLRPTPTSQPWWRMDRLVIDTHAAPPFKGVFGFTIATLGRSQLHQGVLVGLSACGVGLATIILTSARLTTSAAELASRGIYSIVKRLKLRTRFTTWA